MWKIGDRVLGRRLLRVAPRLELARPPKCGGPFEEALESHGVHADGKLLVPFHPCVALEGHDRRRPSRVGGGEERSGRERAVRRTDSGAVSSTA